MRKIIITFVVAMAVLASNGTAAAKESYEITVGETFTYSSCWRGLNANSKVKMYVKRGETWKVVSTSQPKRSSTCDAKDPWITSHDWRPVSSGLFSLKVMVGGSSNEITLRVNPDNNVVQTTDSVAGTPLRCKGQYASWDGGDATVYSDGLYYFPGSGGQKSSKEAACNNWAKTDLHSRAYAENIKRCEYQGGGGGGSTWGNPPDPYAYNAINALCHNRVLDMANRAKAWPYSK